MTKKKRQSFAQIVNELGSTAAPGAEFFSPVREKAIIDWAGNEWALAKSDLPRKKAAELIRSADLVVFGESPRGLYRTELETLRSREELFIAIEDAYYDEAPDDRDVGELVHFGHLFVRPGGHELLYIEEECVP